MSPLKNSRLVNYTILADATVPDHNGPQYGMHSGKRTLNLPFENLTPDNVVIFRPQHNSHGKKDVTGAFKPEAEKFAKFHSLPRSSIFVIDNHQPKHKRVDDVLEILEKEHPLVTVFFCHGYVNGLQLGPYSPNCRKGRQKQWKTRWDAFTKGLSFNYSYNDPNIILYACSTGDDPDGDPDSAPGSGDDSFADRLRDDLCEAGTIYCRIVAHTTAAHTTKNKWVKLFDGGGSRLGGVGAPLVVPVPYLKYFRRLLNTNFRFRFPFLTQQQIHRLVEAEASKHGKS